jgi:hypothetical protein
MYARISARLGTICVMPATIKRISDKTAPTYVETRKMEIPLER